MTLADLAASCDVFYIGGTKVGALFGEAVVFPGTTPRALYDRREAAGRPAGQGLAAGGAVRRPVHRWTLPEAGQKCHRDGGAAERGFREKGFSFYLDTPTNQIFLVVDRAQREDLARKAAFSFWEQLDEERTVIRFVTSWATRMEDVEELIRRL